MGYFIVISDFDLMALHAALDEARLQRQMSWSGVAKEIDVSVSTIRGIIDRPRVEGDGVLQMLLWLDRAPECFIPRYDGEQIPLCPVESGKVLRWDTRAIFNALDDKRQCNNLTWIQVADEIGSVSQSQLKNLAKGGRTSFPVVMRMILWIGEPASRFTREVVT